VQIPRRQAKRDWYARRRTCHSVRRCYPCILSDLRCSGKYRRRAVGSHRGRVTYDPRKVTYQRVLGNFWRSCDPTRDDQFGTRGPAIVWTSSASQQSLAEESRRRLQLSTEYRSPTFGPMFKGRPIVAEIRALAGEWVPAPEQQDFYLNDAKAYEAARKKTGRAKWFEEEYKPVTVTACQKEKQDSGTEGTVCGFVYFPCNDENGCSAVTRAPSEFKVAYQVGRPRFDTKCGPGCTSI